VTGAAGLVESVLGRWEERRGAALSVGVAAVGDWPVTARVNGFPGVSSSAIRTRGGQDRGVAPSERRRVGPFPLAGGRRTCCSCAAGRAAARTGVSRRCGSQGSG